MILKKIFEKLLNRNVLVGIWETKHGDNRENLMRLFEDGSGIIFQWVYEINEEPHEIVYQFEWKVVGFRRIAFKLKNDKKFISINYIIKTYIDVEGQKYDELYDPNFKIGNYNKIKFFWKVNGKLYRSRNVVEN